MKNEKILLIKSKINWADEMNLGGFAIFTESEWKKHLNLLKKCFSYSEFNGRKGIGSNQELFFENMTNYKKHLKIMELSSIESKKLLKQFDLKINNGEDSKAWIFSSFGVFTAMSTDYLIDFLYNAENGKEWLRKNGYNVE